jgi:hypothetical protein
VTVKTENALRGIAIPRGTSTDYLGHIRGEDVQTDVTSWTLELTTACRFGDIILEIDFDTVRDRVVEPHPLPLKYQEREVLVKGPVHNAIIIRK